MAKILFLANSKWYLNNFRYSTITKFKSEYNISICYPANTSQPVLEDIHSYTFKLDPTSQNPLKEILTLFSLFRVFIRAKPDIIFSFNPKPNLYALMLAWLARKPLCCPNVSGLGDAQNMKGYKKHIYNALFKFFYKKSPHIFFQNDTDRSLIIGNVLPNNFPHEVLPGSGVDLEKFNIVSTNNDGRRNFLMAARLIKTKGVLEYLEAAQSCHSAISPCFYLAGVNDSSTRAVPLESIDNFVLDNDRIFFLGEVARMSELLVDIDCVVLPSYYPEGTPRSLLEAAAAGKVIITTDTPGCRDVVVEGINGYLVPPRDTEALKVAMEKVINLSDEKLAEMQASSRKLAEEKFDEQYVIQRYLDVAEKVLAKKSK